jgi:hypothetical protein
MLRKSEMVVWAAVITGLDYCQQSDAPLATLGDFLGQLQQKDWSRTDIKEVERCVLELLRWRKEQQACPYGTQPDRNGFPQRWRLNGRKESTEVFRQVIPDNLFRSTARNSPADARRN